MELYEYTAHELAKMYRNKETTVPKVVESVFKRIEEKEDTVKAYISLDKENALKRAEEIQSEFDEGKDMPILAGIPVAIKDNICTKGVKTTCASKMLEDFVPPYNATVIEKLNENKCILIGKTNLDNYQVKL